MTLEGKLKAMIQREYGSVQAFANAAGLKNTTVFSILNRGVNNASVTNIIAMCHTLGISTDELAEGRITPVIKDIKQGAKMTDLEEIIEYTKANISTYSDLTYKGNPLTEDAKCMLVDALDLCMEFINRRYARQTNKQ